MVTGAYRRLGCDVVPEDSSRIILQRTDDSSRCKGRDGWLADAYVSDMVYKKGNVSDKKRLQHTS